MPVSGPLSPYEAASLSGLSTRRAWVGLAIAGLALDGVLGERSSGSSGGRSLNSAWTTCWLVIVHPFPYLCGDFYK